MVPNLYGVTVCRLRTLDDCFLVIGVFDVSGAEKATIETDDVDLICGHVALPISGGSATGLSATGRLALEPLPVIVTIWGQGL
jgi:hypothetical protein